MWDKRKIHNLTSGLKKLTLSLNRLYKTGL